MSRHLSLLPLVLALLMVAAVVLRRPRPPAAPATPEVASSGPAATDRQPRPIYALHSEPGEGTVAIR